MYKVKAIITIKGSINKGYLEGLYCPKNGTTDGSKIKSQSEAFIRQHMIKKDSCKPDDLDIKITYLKLADDFMIVEDKIESYEKI